MAGFAQTIISLTAQVTGAGAGTPPITSDIPSRHHPASLNAATAGRTESGTVIVCSPGTNRGGLRSASTNESAIGPSDRRATSRRISRTVAVSRSP